MIQLTDSETASTCVHVAHNRWNAAITACPSNNPPGSFVLRSPILYERINYFNNYKDRIRVELIQIPHGLVTYETINFYLLTKGVKYRIPRKC